MNSQDHYSTTLLACEHKTVTLYRVGLLLTTVYMTVVVTV